MSLKVMFGPPIPEKLLDVEVQPPLQSCHPEGMLVTSCEGATIPKPYTTCPELILLVTEKFNIQAPAEPLTVKVTPIGAAIALVAATARKAQAIASLERSTKVDLRI